MQAARELCVSTLCRLLLLSLPLLAGAVACEGESALQASLQAPAMEISATDAMKQLRFRVEARTSAAVIEGVVRVVVRPEHSGSDSPQEGQVRVTVYRGPDAVADPAPSNDIVACAAPGPVEVAKDALQGCDGSCSESFVVVFAAEGLGGSPVALPVFVEAEVFYPYAGPPPAGDFLRLTLQ